MVGLSRRADGPDRPVELQKGAANISNSGNSCSLPQINAKGVVVWQESVGSANQIYRWDPKAQTPTNISNNTLDNQKPQINAKGHVVWQVWDGAQWLVYLDGVQIWP